MVSICADPAPPPPPPAAPGAAAGAAAMLAKATGPGEEGMRRTLSVRDGLGRTAKDLLQQKVCSAPPSPRLYSLPLHVQPPSAGYAEGREGTRL